jgi:phospholipid/cholesterol/gamma-HCH transport system ATP-binding protein
MTAFDNVALPLRERTKQPERQISKRIHQLFERLDLGDIGDKYPAELSGGMQKRVALARALVFNPRIVLFDEPTTGLDPLRKNAVFMMISRYQREFGFTAVLVTHDLPDVLFFSDRVLTLREGRIAFDGSPLQLDQSPSAFNEGFIHSRDDLRDELNGLSKRAELSRQLPVLQERQCGLAVITIDGFDALEEELGEVAAHLIQSNLVKNLKDIPGFTSEAYSLNRYSFCIITEKVFAADDPDVLWAFDGFKRFLWGLKTDRCVEFSVKLAILDARSTASSEAVRTEGFAKAIQAFKHRCG